MWSSPRRLSRPVVDHSQILSRLALGHARTRDEEAKANEKSMILPELHKIMDSGIDLELGFDSGAQFGSTATPNPRPSKITDAGACRRRITRDSYTTGGATSVSHPLPYRQDFCFCFVVVAHLILFCIFCTCKHTIGCLRRRVCRGSPREEQPQDLRGRFVVPETLKNPSLSNPLTSHILSFFAKCAKQASPRASTNYSLSCNNS